ncbi:MAG: maf-2 [Proteobacteria bacterium]|nr:maf-2 [Pseudomonadota bacterium]
MPHAKIEFRPIVLASGSPHRRELLAKLGLPFQSASPEIDERSHPGERPESLALRLGKDKAVALAPRFPAHLIIGSDQVALLDGRQLHKPGDAANTCSQLRAAAGKSVDFYTSICVLDTSSGECRADLDRTRVHFRTLSDQQIRHYVERDQPFDCAGGFKSEGLGIALFEKLETEDPNALVGLPLIRLVRLLDTFGVSVI